MAIPREKLVEQKAALEQQRDQAVDAVRQLAGALQLVEHLLRLDDELAQAEQAGAVSASQEQQTPADVVGAEVV